MVLWPEHSAGGVPLPGLARADGGAVKAAAAPGDEKALDEVSKLVDECRIGRSPFRSSSSTKETAIRASTRSISVTRSFRRWRPCETPGMH